MLITSLVTYHELGKWTPSLDKVNSFDGIELNDRLRTSVIDMGEELQHSHYPTHKWLSQAVCSKHSHGKTETK